MKGRKGGLCNTSNDNDLTGVVHVPCANLVCTRSYFQRLAIATRDLNISRREIPNWMADALYRDDIIFVEGGRRIAFADDEIERAFNDELSFRWLSDLTAFAERPPKQDAQKRTAKRLQLLACAFWVHCPQIAQHFQR
jgi:hypothetical protein